MPHPSYPKPAIQEALCEIQLKRKASDWSPGRPSSLIDHLREKYPDFETNTQQEFQIAIGPEGALTPMPLPPKIRLQFKQRNRPFVLTFMESVVSINVLRPYPGWDALKNEIEWMWPKAVEVMKPESISRIGMRYINRIVRRSHTETPGKWLKAAQYVPPALLSSGSDFLSRTELRIDDQNQTFITITHDRSISTEAFGSLILDIDRISLVDRDIQAATVLDAVEALHEDVWSTFEDIKNPQLDALMRGEIHESAA